MKTTKISIFISAIFFAALAVSAARAADGIRLDFTDGGAAALTVGGRGIRSDVRAVSLYAVRVLQTLEEEPCEGESCDDRLRGRDKARDRSGSRRG